MHRGSWKSSSSPRIVGVQWSSTVVSTLWGMAPGVAVILVIIFGDRAGVLAAPPSGVVIAVGVPSSRRGVAAFRGSYRPGACPGQGRSCFRGSCPCHSRDPWKRKYEEGMGSWQYSSWSSAEHVLHHVACSHSLATASGMAEQ